MTARPGGARVRATPLPASRAARHLLVASLALLLALVACQAPAPPSLNATGLTEAVAVPDFHLTAAGDRVVSLSDFRGQYVLLYFGYTFCPDVCPTTMADLARVQGAVDDAAENLQTLMITVDPERDTPAVLGDYVSHFHPTFVGLSGTPEEINAAGQAFGLFYELHEGSSESGYLVDHTARIYVIDPDGNYQLSYPYGTPADDIIADLRLLLPSG